jgi:uroporphyrinogen decarboxylase
MNMHVWLEDLKSSRVKKAMPVLSFPCISLMEITVRDLIANSELQAKGMKMVADRVNSAASLSMMDLSVEAEAFGSAIRFSDFDVRTVIGSIVNSEEDADALQIPAVGAGRTAEYIKAIEKTCSMVKDRPVFAGVIGAFSLAGRLLDVTEAMVKCYTEPDCVHKTMEKTTAFLIEYIKAYKEAGANGVVIAEPLTGLLSPDLAAEFSEPYIKRIVDTVQDDAFIVIYHNCGNNTILMIDSILRTGASAFHFGNSINMKEMLSKIPKNIVVMGNIDPSSQFLNGTPQSITEATKKLMSECCNEYPNFVISSGCDIPPKSKWENIDAFFNAVSDFYAG